MEIDFDAAKREATLDDSGLDMARADGVFAAATLPVADNRRDCGQDCFVTVGVLDERMVVLAWTPRNHSCRVVGVRKANGREQGL